MDNNTFKLSNIDAKEVPRYTFNEDTKSIRVEVINGNMSNYKSYPGYIEQVSLPAQKIETTPQVIIQKEYEKIEIPIIITETMVETIEIPVIIKEFEIKEIEKQIIVPELQIIKIPEYITKVEYKEIPVIIKEKELVYVDKLNYKMLFIMQAITLALIIASKLLK